MPADPIDTEAREQLRDVGGRLGAHDKVAAVLEEAAKNADTPGMQGEILMEVAKIHHHVLPNAARAEEVYRQGLGLDEDDAEMALPAAEALEGLYSDAGEHQKLVEMLRLRIRLDQNGDVRLELMGRV